MYRMEDGVSEAKRKGVPGARLPGEKGYRRPPAERKAARDRLLANQLPPRYQRYVDNPELLSELDEEELARGQLRDAQGRFGHRPPNNLPRQFYIKCVQTLYERADNELNNGVYTAVQTMVKLCDSDDPAIAMKAAMWLVERLRGKTPEIIEHKGTVSLFAGDLEAVVKDVRTS